MDLTRTTAAWLIAVVGALFAFVTYVQALRDIHAGYWMALIGVSSMILFWYLAKDSADDPAQDCSDWTPGHSYRIGERFRDSDGLQEITGSYPKPMRRRQWRDRS